MNPLDTRSAIERDHQIPAEFGECGALHCARARLIAQQRRALTPKLANGEHRRASEGTAHHPQTPLSLPTPPYFLDLFSLIAGAGFGGSGMFPLRSCENSAEGSLPFICSCISFICCGGAREEDAAGGQRAAAASRAGEAGQPASKQASKQASRRGKQARRQASVAQHSITQQTTTLFFGLDGQAPSMAVSNGVFNAFG